MSEKTWNFAVVVSSADGVTKFFGSPVDLYEDAVKLQQSAFVVGWKKVAIFDSSLQEVKKKPKPKQPTS